MAREQCGQNIAFYTEHGTMAYGENMPSLTRYEASSIILTNQFKALSVSLRLLKHYYVTYYYYDGRCASRAHKLVNIIKMNIV